MYSGSEASSIALKTYTFIIEEMYCRWECVHVLENMGDQHSWRQLSKCKLVLGPFGQNIAAR